MSILGTILDTGKAIAKSDAAQSLLDAGVDAGRNKILEMSGFEDPQAQSPTAPLAAPKPPPEEAAPKPTMPKWALPVGIGVGVLLFAALLRRK